MNGISKIGVFALSDVGVRDFDDLEIIGAYDIGDWDVAVQVFVRSVGDSLAFHCRDTRRQLSRFS